MIKARTLMKRPSLVRQILLGTRAGEVEVRTVEELRFLYRNGLLRKMQADFRKFRFGDFFKVVDSLDEDELEAYVSNKSFSRALCNNIFEVKVPPRALELFVRFHPDLIKDLVQVLSAETLYHLYRIAGASAGVWILDRATLSARPELDGIVEEVLSDEKNLVENLRQLAAGVSEYRLEMLQGFVLEKFIELAKREDLVGALAVLLLPKKEAEKFVDSPYPLKRAAVASKIEKVELLQKLSKDPAAEVQLALLRRGFFVKSTLKKLLGREDEGARVIISLIMRDSV